MTALTLTALIYSAMRVSVGAPDHGTGGEAALAEAKDRIRNLGAFSVRATIVREWEDGGTASADRYLVASGGGARFRIDRLDEAGEILMTSVRNGEPLTILHRQTNRFWRGSESYALNSPWEWGGHTFLDGLIARNFMLLPASPMSFFPGLFRLEYPGMEQEPGPEKAVSDLGSEEIGGMNVRHLLLTMTRGHGFTMPLHLRIDEDSGLPARISPDLKAALPAELEHLTSARHCQRILQRIDGAKETWFYDQPAAAQTPETMSRELAMEELTRTGRGMLESVPKCPEGFGYSPGSLFKNARCLSGLPGHSGPAVSMGGYQLSTPIPDECGGRLLRLQETTAALREASAITVRCPLGYEYRLDPEPRCTSGLKDHTADRGKEAKAERSEASRTRHVTDENYEVALAFAARPFQARIEFSDWNESPKFDADFFVGETGSASRASHYAMLEQPAHPLTGRPLPDFEARLMSGEWFRCGNLPDGTALVIEFGARWSIGSMYARPLDASPESANWRDVRIITVCVDDGPGDVRDGDNSLCARPGENTVADRDARLARLFQVDSVPQTFITDRRGVIRRVVNGYHSDMDSWAECWEEK